MKVAMTPGGRLNLYATKRLKDDASLVGEKLVFSHAVEDKGRLYFTFSKSSIGAGGWKIGKRSHAWSWVNRESLTEVPRFSATMAVIESNEESWVTISVPSPRSNLPAVVPSPETTYSIPTRELVRMINERRKELGENDASFSIDKDGNLQLFVEYR